MAITELQGIINEVQKIRQKRTNLDEEESLLWKRFFEIADDLAGEGMSYRFVDPDTELFMAREMHQQAPKLNIDALSAQLSDSEWGLISEVERVFKIERLEAALALGQINKAVIEKNTEYPTAVPHKKFGIATKKDLDELV